MLIIDIESYSNKQYYNKELNFKWIFDPFLFRNNSNILESGDTIVVPVKIDTFSPIKAANDLTNIIYQLAVATAAVSSF